MWMDEGVTWGGHSGSDPDTNEEPKFFWGGRFGGAWGGAGLESRVPQHIYLKMIPPLH